MNITVLAIGDIVGQEALGFVNRHLKRIRRDYNISLVIANGENVAFGNGLDRQSAETLLAAGVDVITTGNHVWHKRDIKQYLDETAVVLRPANYPAACPGVGYCLLTVEDTRFLVINALGTIYIEPTLSCPFTTVERILDYALGKYDIAILDFHAEATSEKAAVARYFDGRSGGGRLSAMFGTHTHVATADEQVLSGGTGFITDIGMTGPTDSILGIRTSCILEKLRMKMPVRFETAEGNIELSGALFTINPETSKTVSVERIRLSEADFV